MNEELKNEIETTLVECERCGFEGLPSGDGEGEWEEVHPFTLMTPKPNGGYWHNLEGRYCQDCWDKRAVEINTAEWEYLSYRLDRELPELKKPTQYPNEQISLMRSSKH